VSGRDLPDYPALALNRYTYDPRSAPARQTSACSRLIHVRKGKRREPALRRYLHQRFPLQARHSKFAVRANSVPDAAQLDLIAHADHSTPVRPERKFEWQGEWLGDNSAVWTRRQFKLVPPSSSKGKCFCCGAALISGLQLRAEVAVQCSGGRETCR
jgi:hypothetical protein